MEELVENPASLPAEFLVYIILFFSFLLQKTPLKLHSYEYLRSNLKCE